MGCLRAYALISASFILERRAASIGTLFDRSQRKLRGPLVVGLLLASAHTRSALAAGSPPPSADAVPAPAAALGPPPPPPAPVSPFTGAGDGPPSASAPLPPPPPPASAPVAGGDALPPPPPPRGAAAPPAAVAANGAPTAAPPGAPGSDLPPPPRAARGVHSHDGFYLRMALGLGASGALVSSDAKSIPNYSFSGGGGAFDLWLGGTPTPGVAMGGALSVLGVSSTTRRVDGESQAGTVTGNMALLGFFVDGFPDPERGFHFGGTLGLASAHAEVKQPATKFSGGGVGLGAWLGYDMWVGSQWSLGGMLQLMGSITRQHADGVSYETSIGGATLGFTALYH